MSFIVPLIVSAAAVVAVCGVIVSTLLAVKGFGHFGKFLSQVDGTGAEEQYLPARRYQKAESAVDTPTDDPIFYGEPGLDRLAQYFDRP